MADRPTARVISVNVAAPRPDPGGADRVSGIDKRPVPHIDVFAPGPNYGDGSGVVGDVIGDVKHHGGAQKAVYAFAREELDAWERQLGRELPHGMFGENLTTLGIDVDAAEVGDRWRVGTAVLEVRGPRVPCATFGERMGERGWVRRFAAHGRSGAYLQVVEPGEIRPGDAITATPSGSGLTVPTYLRAWFGDPDAARTALDSGVLTGDRRAELERVTARR